MNKKMLFGTMAETTGHGKILKKGIAVLALSGALLVGGAYAGTVSADEVTDTVTTEAVVEEATEATTTDSTEAAEATPATGDATEVTDTASTQETPTYTTTVDPNEDITNAVENATEVLGADQVTQDPSVVVPDEATALQDYETQAAQINQAVTNYQDAQKAYEAEQNRVSTQVNVQVKGKTSEQEEWKDTHSNQVYSINSKTTEEGNWSIQGFYNDEVSNYAHHLVTGTYTWHYTVNEGVDGEPASITITIDTVTYKTASVTKTGTSMAVSNPVTYVYDVNGDLIASWTDETKTLDINKTVNWGHSFTLGLGESSGALNVASVFDDWVIDHRINAQIEFSNTTKSNTLTKPEKPAVTWHLNAVEEELEVVKDVVNNAGDSINKGELKVGDTAYYKLTGAYIRNQSSEALKSYQFVDYLTTTHDEYKGWSALIPEGVTIKLKDGTTVTNDMLMANSTVSYDSKTGKWMLSVNSDFLAALNEESAFQMAVLIEYERIASGTVYNTYTNVVNGQEVVSNTVETHTPEEPAPTPKTPATPVAPTPETPVAAAAVLPSTGEETSIMGMIGATLLGGLAILGLAKKKEVD